MGNDLRHKGLLFDEADFPLPRDCDMDTLIRTVEDFCVAEFHNEFDHPSLEIFGVASEGFEEPCAWGCVFSKALWIKPETRFRDIFLDLANELGISVSLMIETIQTGRTNVIETHLKDRIRALLDDRAYFEAQRLMQYMPALWSIGLAGVRDAGEFDTRGEDMIVDYRVGDYGPGRRILVEIAFNWGQ